MWDLSRSGIEPDWDIPRPCTAWRLFNHWATSEEALVILIIIARPTSAITIRKHWENKGLLLTGPGNYTVQWGRRARSWGGREGERTNWVSTFTGVKGGGAKVLSVHSCQTTDWHLPSTSTRIIKSVAAAAADLQCPRKGVQGRGQKWGTLSFGKTGRTGLQTDVFRSQFMSLILVPPHGDVLVTCILLVISSTVLYCA